MGNGLLKIVAPISGKNAYTKNTGGFVFLVPSISREQAEFMLGRLELMKLLFTEHQLETFTVNRDAVTSVRVNGPTILPTSTCRLPSGVFLKMPRLAKELFGPEVVDEKEYNRRLGAEAEPTTYAGEGRHVWEFQAHLRVPQSETTTPVSGVVNLVDIEPGLLPKQIPEVVGTVRFQCDHLKSFRLYPNIFREVLARYAATEEAKDV